MIKVELGSRWKKTLNLCLPVDMAVVLRKLSCRPRLLLASVNVAVGSAAASVPFAVLVLVVSASASSSDSEDVVPPRPTPWVALRR